MAKIVSERQIAAVIPMATSTITVSWKLHRCDHKHMLTRSQFITDITVSTSTNSGIKRRSTSTYWTETTAGHRRGKEIPVCWSCHADGTRTPSPPRNWVDTSWRQKKKRSTKEDLAISILEKIYRQEESAGARKRQWQPTVCVGETCCPLFHEEPEDIYILRFRFLSTYKC